MVKRVYSLGACAALVAACGGAESAGGGGEGAGGAVPQGPSTSGTTSGAGTGSGTSDRACDGFATDVVSVTYGPGAGFGQGAMPEIVLGPPRGGGELSGSLDVVALGNGGEITLAFKGTVLDGPGADFIVFENVFFAGGDPSAPFAELGTVSVSEDGDTWHAFPCTATTAPFELCAGVQPTLAGPDFPGVDPQDPESAGGDAFDLADVGLASARFVRVTDREDLGGLAGVFDLDAIALVNFQCDAE